MLQRRRQELWQRFYPRVLHEARRRAIDARDGVEIDPRTVCRRLARFAHDGRRKHLDVQPRQLVVVVVRGRQARWTSFGSDLERHHFSLECALGQHGHARRNSSSVRV